MGEVLSSNGMMLLNIADEALKSGLTLRQRYFHKDNSVCLIGAMSDKIKKGLSAISQLGIMAGFDGENLDNPGLSYVKNNPEFLEYYKDASDVLEVLASEGKVEGYYGRSIK